MASYILVEITRDGYDEVHKKGKGIVKEKLMACGITHDDVKLVQIKHDEMDSIFAIVPYDECVANAIDETDVRFVTQKSYEELLTLYPDAVAEVEIVDDGISCSIM